MMNICKNLAFAVCVGLLACACAPVAPHPPSLACKSLPASAGGKDQAVQRALADLGYQVGTLDGKMNSETMVALRKFQRDMALPENGRVDAQTLEALGFCPANSGSANSGCMNSPSDRHGQLQAVQQILSQQGYDPGPADGQMGQKTRDALRQFQASRGLRETGKADTATREALGFCGGSASGR